MNKIKILILVTVLVNCFFIQDAWSKNRHKDGCPDRLSDVNVTVDIKEGTVYRDNSISLDELQTKAMQNSHIDPSSKYSKVTGLTSSSVSTKIGGGFKTFTNETEKSSCFYVQDLNIILGLDITVDVAREYPRGSCAYDVILEHEMGHVDVERKVMYYFAPVIKKNVEEAVRKIGVKRNIPSKNLQKEVQRMNKYLDSIISSSLKRKTTKRNKMQAKLDSEDEYERTSKRIRKCEKKDKRRKKYQFND